MILLDQMKRFVRKIEAIRDDVHLIRKDLAKVRESVGRIEGRQTKAVEHPDLASHEFRVFSQWGEDGIIQYLIENVNISKEVFVEFGVQDYTESNTRFLLVNNNWSGLVIDGDNDQINYIKRDPIYWQYNLKAVNSFITKDNINSIMSENGIKGEIGLLSVDIDGNDYWVWDAIDVISPSIVISEYNHRFGNEKSVTVPYDKDFVRENAHYSMIYYGASLKALVNLGKRKHYAFVGCNTAGNNAFFVRRDLLPEGLHEMTAEEGFVAGKFRESRDREGKLSFLTSEEEAQLLLSLPLVHLD